MAERRMLAKSVILYDRLADMSHATQLLYIYLNLQADDDGFVGNPRTVVKMLRARNSQLQELIDHGFLLQFDSGVVVITHWRVHNQIRRDRHKSTRYVEEQRRLRITESGMYERIDDTPDQERLPDGCHLVADSATQDRIGKDRIGKDRLGKDREDEDMPEEAGMVPPAADSSSSQKDFENTVLSLYAKHCPSLPPCDRLCKDTRENIKALQASGWTAGSIGEAFQLAGKLPFLKGENDTGWQADLNWLCKAGNLQKVLSGRYEKWKKGQKTKTIYGGGQLGQAELEAIQQLLADNK